jgi:trypsin
MKCVFSASPTSLKLRCGTEYHATPGIDYTLAQVIAHPSYSSWSLDYDLGLIRISGSFSLGSNNINAIALPAQDEQLAPGSTVTVTGWGALTEGGYLPAVLQTLDVPVVANDVCSAKYSGFNDVTDRMFCAGVDAGGKDSCQVWLAMPSIYYFDLLFHYFIHYYKSHVSHDSHHSEIYIQLILNHSTK